MKILHLDHLVLTVANVERSVGFYTTHLGMKRLDFGEGRVALLFGFQKINLHPLPGYEPKAQAPTPGSGDLCFIVEDAVETLKESLEAGGIRIIQGPIRRTGAQSALRSIYLRDPDGNLIELSNVTGA